MVEHTHQPGGDRKPRYWVIAPVESKPVEQFDKVWQFDLVNGLISIGWDVLGDVSKMDRESLSKSVATAYPDRPSSTKALIVNMLWVFWNEIAPGDIVIARRGRKTLAAVGNVVCAAFYAPGSNPHLASPSYSHHGFIKIDWQEQPRNKCFADLVFPMQTVKAISESDYFVLMQAEDTPVSALLTSEPAGQVEDKIAIVLEKYLEDFIVSNFDTIFKGELQMYQDGLGADGQQFQTDIGKIDILAVELKSNSFVVIELKKGKGSDQVIGQVLRYMGWVRKKLCDEGQAVRGLIICDDSDQKLSFALDMISNVAVQYYSVSFKLSPNAPSPIVP